MQLINKNIFLNTIFCGTLGWRLRNGKIHPDYSEAELFRMEQGKKIHSIARSLHPTGVFVNETSSTAAATRTHSLLDNSNTNAIFEAAFLAGNYVAKSDVLVKNAGSWELIEVKSNVSAKNELIDDLAYTTMVAQTDGFTPSTISLMHIDKNYRLGMPDDRLFVKTDVTDSVIARAEEFKTVADHIDLISSTPEEPEPVMIFNCKQCDYFTECIGEGIDSPIFQVPRINQSKIEELIAASIISIHDIPSTFSLSDNQRRVVDCVQSGEVHVDPTLRKKLEQIHWPAYYLDFETMMTVLPLWLGIAPYDHIPIQYSLHTRPSLTSDISHREYLADPSRDCRHDLAKKLIEDLNGEGSIITYSSFEKTTISSLSKLFPDLAEDLQSLLPRIVDLEQCVKCINHPKFCGRTSIKVALPVLVPELTYNGLEIGNGDDALVTFAKMALRMMPPDEEMRKRIALLEYCKMDTLAMVRLHEALNELCKNYL
jgi:hypothetical protein